MNNDLPNLEVSWPNAISFSIYYGVRLIGLFLFAVSLIPIALIFSPIFPGVFTKIANKLELYAETESKNLDRDWKRLARKLK